MKAGSGVLTLGAPDSPGVPATTAGHTLSVRFNDLDSVRSAFSRYPGEIAAVIVEPVAGNMGVVPPADGFLSGLRSLTTDHGALLIFDEVITGFRLAYGGAQQRFGLRADLTCLGKIIGGGLPVGAYGGPREIMRLVAPQGPVYQAGTLSGNPLAMAAGLATLEELRRSDPYKSLERNAARLERGLLDIAEQAQVRVSASRVGSMMTLFFAPSHVHDYDSARMSNTAQYGAFFRAMLDRGVYLAPSQFEAAFLSTAHTSADVDAAVAAATEAIESAAS